MNSNLLKKLLATSILAALVGATSAYAAQPVSATASGHDGNGPEQMLDGDINTRWSANGEGAWVMFDYGAPITINAVKLAFHQGNARSTFFDVETSLDGKTWTKVIDKTGSSGKSLELERFEFDEVNAQYVRVTGYGNSANKWNSLTEFAAVDCNVDACPAGELPREDILKPVAITASSDDGNGPDFLFDGDITSRWSSQGDGEWAMLDYGKVAEFDAVRLAFHNGDQRATKFDIEVSADGKTWTRVVSGGQSSGAVAAYERFEFNPVKAQYVKYIGHGNTKNNWNSVTEFAALNCAINACPADHIITEDVIAAYKATQAAKQYEVKHAGEVTTLDDWKITLPTTNAGYYGDAAKGDAADEYYALQGTTAESAAEILPGNCSVDGSSLADTKNEYFWVDDKGWHFRTPLEGGTTTPHSTYIRTELRELAGGWKPCDATPTANWGYGGTHTLTATLTLDEIPANPLKTDGVTKTDPKVVLGQIHAKDIDAATVKLLWEGKDKPVRVILNKSTEKSAFSVKLGKIQDPSKPWSYMIKMTEEGIDLAAGGEHKTLTFGKELDNAWKNETFYFKAGLYPQVSKNSGGAFEATFSTLSIEHTKRAGDFGVHVPLVCNPDFNDCSCVKTNPDCTWWDVPLKAPKLPAKPLPGNKPSQNFDLTTWYLSQPFDHDNNGKPDDVFEMHLAQGYEHPDLFYTADDGGLVFKSYIKGVRTSNNTKFVRTEMREMLRAGDTSIPSQGVNKNNWVFSSAPIEDQKAAGGVDGVMEATLKIDHTTTTGDPNEVGRFIIGQIHDRHDEPIRLYYRKLPNRDTGSVYFAHQVKGVDTFFELLGDMSGITDDGIALGEVFTYRIEVVGNTMTVTLKRDGKPDVIQVVDMSESGYDEGGKYMYFKAGVYNQNRSGDPDDYIQATFYKIEKTHGTYTR